MGRTHLVLGAASAWGLLALPQLSFHPALVVIAAFSALLPDLDASESMLGHLTIGNRKGFGIAPLRVFTVLGGLLFKHRAVLHSLFVLAIIVAGVAVGIFFSSWPDVYWPEARVEIPLAVGLGFLSHLLADSITGYGVPFLWPKKKRYHLIPRRFTVRLKSPEENAIYVLGGVVAAGWLIVALLKFTGMG